MTTYLVQNIETFETITTFASTEAFDTWMDESSLYGIVSLDSDADGEYDFVALVAPLSGPDFVMDETTGEMEPVEDIDPAAELAAKMEIMMELDNADEEIFAAITVQDTVREEASAEGNVLAAGQAVLDEWVAESETMSEWTCGGEPIPLLTINGKTQAEFEAEQAADETTITKKKPRKARKTKTKSRTKAKGANMSQPKRIRNFEILVSFIEANPGVSRTDVFNDASLLLALRSSAQIAAIGKGDKVEVKRWNRRLNFLIRESKRQGVDIQIERKGRVAHYTIVPASGQLELPFDEAAEARNAAITGDLVTDETVIEKPAVDVKRAEEPENVSLNFEDLLATLDDDAATVTSDDQVAFENAKEMLK